MGRSASVGVGFVLAFSALSAGCGEPVSVLGDIPGLMRIVVGVPDESGTDVGASAVETLLRSPSGLDMDLEGVLYVADRDNRRIVAATSSGAVRLVMDDRLCRGDCLREITDLAVDGSGGLIVADERGHSIWHFDIATGARTLLAGTGESGTTPDGEPAASSAINSPRGVAVGDGGEVYFAEGRSHLIRTILADGTLSTVAGTGESGFSGDGGAATAAQLDFPGGIDVMAGVLYIADTGNQRVRSVDLTRGTIATVAGNGITGFGGDGGDPLIASFRQVRDVAVTDDGLSLYVADSGNHRIRLVSLASPQINTFAGNGETEFAGNLIDAGAAQLEQPLGVATSPFGLVLISDTGHHIVWRTPTGL